MAWHSGFVRHGLRTSGATSRRSRRRTAAQRTHCRLVAAQQAIFTVVSVTTMVNCWQFAGNWLVRAKWVVTWPCCERGTPAPRRPGQLRDREHPRSRTSQGRTGRVAARAREADSRIDFGAARQAIAPVRRQRSPGHRQGLDRPAGPRSGWKPSPGAVGAAAQLDGAQRCLLHHQRAIYSLVSTSPPGGLTGTDFVGEGAWWRTQIAMHRLRAPEAASVAGPADGVRSPSGRQSANGPHACRLSAAGFLPSLPARTMTARLSRMTRLLNSAVCSAQS